MPIAKKTQAYIDSLKDMEGIVLIEQFFKWKNPISRYEVALEIDRRSAIDGVNRLVWMRKTLVVGAPEPAKENLHERHQAPIHDAFAPNFIKKK